MRKAHTLVESIMVIVLVGIISFVFSLYIQEGFNSWQFLSGQKSISLSARAALNRMVREIKLADNIILLNDHELFFEDVAHQFVHYTQDGTDLKLNDDILLSNLAPGGLSFSYKAADGAPAINSEDVRVVVCRLTVVKDENKFVIESSAALRMRML